MGIVAINIPNPEPKFRTRYWSNVLVIFHTNCVHETSFKFTFQHTIVLECTGVLEYSVFV